MKKKLFYIAANIFVLLLLCTCKKYDDGPSFSFSSAGMRLCKLWYIDKVYENNIDNTANFKNLYYQYNINYLTNGKYFVKYLDKTNNIEYTSNGTWNFDDHKKYLVRIPDGSDSIKFKILKLKSDQLWLLYEKGNQEWHFSY